MLRFFSKIRFKLAAENKAGKYLRYAIGEILLVVIGILIALQINNWNEEKKLKTKEIKMIKEFRNDLIQSLNDIEGNIADLNACLNSNQIILQCFENQLAYHDSLDYHFAKLYPYIVFSANQTTYDNAKQTGFQLISNDTLRTSISNLYGNLFQIYRESEQSHLIKHYHDYLKPMFVLEFTSFELSKSMHPKNYSKFIESSENKQTLNFTVEACKSFIQMQSFLKSEVQRILDIIEVELYS